MEPYSTAISILMEEGFRTMVIMILDFVLVKEWFVINHNQ